MKFLILGILVLLAVAALISLVANFTRLLREISHDRKQKQSQKETAMKEYNDPLKMSFAKRTVGKYRLSIGLQLGLAPGAVSVAIYDTEKQEYADVDDTPVFWPEIKDDVERFLCDFFTGNLAPEERI